jgi:hypothetical protein
VADSRRALEAGNINYARKWIQADGDDELTEVFTKTLAVRKLTPQAADLADRLFLETLVRLHRMGEGVGFIGIQPTGTKIEPIVATADQAMETGDDHEVIALAPADRGAELHRRFEVARGKQRFDVDEVKGARDFVVAYVSFYKYAEGEDHEHGHHAHVGGAHDGARAQHEHANR